MRIMNQDMEIICIGNELLIGKTLNTNAQWIAQQATALGIKVKRIVAIADETNEISTTLHEALKRKPQFTITTGGLGPTFDDKTLEGVAQALNRKLEINPTALKMVRKKYDKYAIGIRKGTMELTPPRIKMATLPENSEPIPNPVGTAPGVKTEIKQTLVIALPGVPAEMKSIFKQNVIPLLKQRAGENRFYSKSMYVNNVMESSLAPLIDKTMLDNPGVYVKSHPKGREERAHIEIHASTTSDTAEKAEKKLQKALRQIMIMIEEVGGKVLSKKTIGS